MRETSRLALVRIALFGLSGLCANAFAQPKDGTNPPNVPATVPSVTGANPCERLATPNLADADGKSIDFARIADAPTHVMSAKIVDAANDVPAFCHVIGYVSPSVGIELRLPMTAWNGKFAEVGCGGMCGGIQAPGCESALIKGYACVMSDMGHRGTQIDAAWGYNNLQAKIDFGYRATHVAALAGKFITRVFYGQDPRLSYFIGCSTGGRQGLISAQRFPYDFDAILAGAPPMNEIGDGLDILWSVKAAANADGTPLMKSTDLALVTKAVLKQCDMDDGVLDGVVGDPRRCAFDPRKLICKAGEKTDQPASCLQPAQAEALRKIYAGPHDAKGRRWYYGIMPGSEPVWVGSLQRDDGQVSHYQAFMTSMFRFLNFMPDAGPLWTPAQFNWEEDPKRLDLVEALFNAQNPDLRRFKAAGGKLLLFHGWNDHIVQPEATVDYYETVERTMGGRAQTQDFFRLFMAPGVNHCQSGTGAYAVDWLGALEDWVEKGRAPDRILAVRPKELAGGLYPRFFTPVPGVMDNAIFSRPLFPYPVRAIYSGAGDPSRADSFKEAR